MPTIQSLKKQLRGIRSTQKLTKAMKTISSVKFSKLNGIYGKYADYCRQCEKIYAQYGAELVKAVEEADSTAPVAVVVLAANKGLCGSFNAELLNFAREELAKIENYRLVACGKKAMNYFKGKNFPLEKEYVINDVPSYEESVAILDEILAWRTSGKVSGVYVIYPAYTNMMKQTPVIRDLFAAEQADDYETVFFVPDRSTIVAKSAKTVLRAIFYELVLEAALGAQAATLMTMRSAYDTATDYCTRLEGQINRKRQSAVTADVLETATEWGE